MFKQKITPSGVNESKNTIRLICNISAINHNELRLQSSNTWRARAQSTTVERFSMATHRGRTPRDASCDGGEKDYSQWHWNNMEIKKNT